ncbi:uncharacterized protein TNCV_1509661 [Trichonephila clavipes]|nr:uncharacterized protein TNCV_1509661 [Trichonephila clavipes]
MLNPGTMRNTTHRRRGPDSRRPKACLTLKESDPVDDETDGHEDNNNESSKGPSNANSFSPLETAMEWYEQQSECCPIQLLLLKRIRNLAAKKRRCIMVQRKMSDYFPQ